VNLLAPGSTTAFSINPNQVTYGTPATLTATVTASGSSAPTGQVTFFDSVTSIGTGTVNSGGLATLSATLAGGGHLLTAMYDGDSTYTSSTSNQSFILDVTHATPVLNLASSASAATPSTSVTLTATAVGVTGEAVPTGAVTFYNGKASLGSTNLSSAGVATLAVQGLPVGADMISATYAADTNYASASSASITINVAAMSTFSLSSGNLSLSIPQGQSGTATLSVTPVGGFSSQVQFSCSGLPQYASCSFAPASITPGNSAVTTTLTIATNQQQAGVGLASSGLSYAGALLLFLGGIRRFRRRIGTLSVALCVLLMAAGVGAIVGCGGGSASASHITPAGNSTVVVSATSGSTVQTVNLTVTITQN